MMGSRKPDHDAPPEGVTRGVRGPAERRAIRLIWILLPAWIVLPFIVSLLILMALEALWGKGNVMVAVVVFGAVFWVQGSAIERMRRRARRADLRRLERARFQVCLFCWYDLSRLAPVGQCPECGSHYERPHVERSWRWAYRGRG